jgi:hypothetical protein
MVNVLKKTALAIFTPSSLHPLVSKFKKKKNRLSRSFALLYLNPDDLVLVLGLGGTYRLYLSKIPYANALNTLPVQVGVPCQEQVV